MGRNDEVGQLRPVKCTYADCNKHFDTEKLMKRHKLDDSNHFYCKKCDYDAIDDQDLILHKVRAMQPWVEGGRKKTHGECPKHIVCEFCGVDFGSFGGRRIHREQNHPADQEMVCPGCQTVFTRAGSYLAHFENGKCPSISRRQFLAQVQYKHVQPKLPKAAHEFHQNLLSEEPTNDTSGMINGEEETSDTGEGGVNILDNVDANQQTGMQPLKAEVNFGDLHPRPRLTRSNLEEWPRLPVSKTAQFTEALKNLSIGPSKTEAASSIHETHESKSELTSQTTSRRDGTKIFSRSVTSTNLTKTISPGGFNDSVSEASTSKASSREGSPAWTTSSTSQILFKGAKSKSSPADWDGILKKRAEVAECQPTTNLLHSRFWDPASPEFKLPVFWNEAIGRYWCRFDDCDALYDLDIDLIAHLQHAHLKTSYRCPLCQKIFKTASALIGHSESNGKCKIKKSGVYQKLLDEVSGGFLKAASLHQPEIAKEQNGMLRIGVMSTKFTAKMPDEL